ncbi:MAG: ABC transporter ATP-binding protein [Spirochaetia bacterium]|jgi:ABC-2 type transport system ATP-binding protein
MLEIKGLEKSYGSLRVLRGVDLSVAQGEICGLVGPNGAGKTTLVSILTGLRDPDAGEARVDGRNAFTDRRRLRRLIGCAPQDLGIYPTLNVRANLEFFGRWNGVRARELPERIEEVCHDLDITDLLDRKVMELSGGQKRRVHTALALLHRPRLLFLDEPTVGADVQARMKLLAEVKKLAAQGTAIVYATHYLAEIETLGATVAILEEGRIRERGTLAEVVGRNGRARAELEFDGDAPALEGWQRSGPRTWTLASDPASATGSAIARLSGDASRLRNVRIIPSSLESAYLSITGHGADAPQEEKNAIA